MSRPLLFLALAASAVAAQDKKPPRLLVVSPILLAPGGTAKLTLRGSNFDGLASVTVGDPKAKAKLLDAPKKSAAPNQHPKDREGDSEVTVEVTLPKDRTADELTLTVAGPGGASNPLRVAVSDGNPRTPEKEPNDGFAAAQPILVGQVVDGVISRDKDVDVFRFDGAAGARLRIEVRAARLGSPLDAVLAVYDADHRLLATNDDTDGSPDPAVSVTLPRAGAYFVSVLDANDLGAGYYHYHLRIAVGR